MFTFISGEAGRLRRGSRLLGLQTAVIVRHDLQYAGAADTDSDLRAFRDRGPTPAKGLAGDVQEF